ncbi:MAG: hypothetical protein WCJ34_10860 [Alcaligenaceae bacterium]|jgi:hypothetical protein
MFKPSFTKKIVAISFVAVTTLLTTPTLFAQTAHNLLGTWKGLSNSAVLGAGLFHPNEAGKESAIRFRRVEYQIVIEKEEGRNFAGYIGATDKAQPTNLQHKEVILGAYAKDMKSGVAVNESGRFTFQLLDPKTIEVCYTQVTANAPATPLVASCFELIKQ